MVKAGGRWFGFQCETPTLDSVMEAKTPILVVEDEEAIRSGLCDILTYHGYTPTGSENGKDGLCLALDGRYALVLLDVMLPDLSGFDVCRTLRTQRPQQAVLMLTARGAEEDIVHGFRCGADDYVTKPFSVSELMARIGAVLRRTGGVREATAPFEFGVWRVDPANFTMSCGQQMIELSRREIEMLALFARERGRIVSRRSLLVEVWGMAHVDRIETRTVDMHMAKLRKKIAPGGSAAIETVRGEGYRFIG
jgi:DNA-binding response OmpR family regulator